MGSLREPPLRLMSLAGVDGILCLVVYTNECRSPSAAGVAIGRVAE